MLKRLTAEQKKQLLDKLRSPGLYKKPVNKYADLSVEQLLALDDEKLLDAVNDERIQFTETNDARQDAMVAELVRRKIYPARGCADKYDARKMMDSWGTYWFRWSGALNCPHCNSDLRDLHNGPPFKREIAMYDQRRDSTTHYKCPDCNKEFPRR